MAGSSGISTAFAAPGESSSAAVTVTPAIAAFFSIISSPSQFARIAM
jgi:hypothetical protein